MTAKITKCFRVIYKQSDLNYAQLCYDHENYTSDSTQTGQHCPSCTVDLSPGPHSGSGHCVFSQGSLQMGQHCQEGVMKPSTPHSGISHTTPAHDASATALGEITCVHTYIVSNRQRKL